MAKFDRNPVQKFHTSSQSLLFLSVHLSQRGFKQLNIHLNIAIRLSIFLSPSGFPLWPLRPGIHSFSSFFGTPLKHAPMAQTCP